MRKLIIRTFLKAIFMVSAIVFFWKLFLVLGFIFLMIGGGLPVVMFDLLAQNAAIDFLVQSFKIGIPCLIIAIISMKLIGMPDLK